MVYRTYFIRIIIIFYLFHSLLYSFYDIGDTISLSDQQIDHEICYGDYENDTYEIGDANYLINGGKKRITIMKLSASW